MEATQKYRRLANRAALLRLPQNEFADVAIQVVAVECTKKNAVLDGIKDAYLQGSRIATAMQLR